MSAFSWKGSTGAEETLRSRPKRTPPKARGDACSAPTCGSFACGKRFRSAFERRSMSRRERLTT